MKVTWTSNLIGGAAAVLVVSGVWWAADQRHATPTNELVQLYASPVCQVRNGAPRTGGPTVAEAWRRMTRQPLSRARPLFHGDRSIELRLPVAGDTVYLAFLRVGARSWQPATDGVTAGWVAQVCGTR